LTEQFMVQRWPVGVPAVVGASAQMGMAGVPTYPAHYCNGSRAEPVVGGFRRGQRSR
jgi:hypothetical protein